jgi:hypothetical protein
MKTWLSKTGDDTIDIETFEKQYQIIQKHLNLIK